MKVSNENVGVSDENVGVFNENVGVSNQTSIVVSNEKMSNLCMITGTTLCPRSSSSFDFSPKFEKNNPILFQIRKSRLSISSQYLLTRRSKIKISEKKNYSENKNLLSFVHKKQLIFRDSQKLSTYSVKPQKKTVL